MTVAWPSNVNQVQYDPRVKQPVDQRSTFQADAGVPKIASLSTDTFYDVQYDVLFTAAEVDAFWTWWGTTAARGAQAFTGINDVHSNTARTYIFAPGSVPSFQRFPSAAELYRATFTLIQLPP